MVTTIKKNSGTNYSQFYRLHNEKRRNVTTTVYFNGIPQLEKYCDSLIGRRGRKKGQYYREYRCGYFMDTATKLNDSLANKYKLDMKVHSNYQLIDKRECYEILTHICSEAPHLELNMKVIDGSNRVDSCAYWTGAMEHEKYPTFTRQGRIYTFAPQGQQPSVVYGNKVFTEVCGEFSTKEKAFRKRYEVKLNESFQKHGLKSRMYQGYDMDDIKKVFPYNSKISQMRRLQEFIDFVENSTTKQSHYFLQKLRQNRMSFQGLKQFHRHAQGKPVRRVTSDLVKKTPMTDRKLCRIDKYIFGVSTLNDTIWSKLGEENIDNILTNPSAYQISRRCTNHRCINPVHAVLYNREHNFNIVYDCEQKKFTLNFKKEQCKSP